MKKLSTLVIAVSLSFAAAAQSSLPPVDQSPMDMSYYPANYPVLKIQDKIMEPLVARVIYSRPKKEGRTIFGGLVEYGKVWRLGANEATEIEFYRKVNIGGKKVSKGRYNKETDTWGSFKYNAEKDIIRTNVLVEKLNDPVESLAMTFEKGGGGINLVIAWENVKVTLPINL